MNVAPFILRELREQSRSAVNPWLRVAWVACLAGLLVFGLFNSGVVDLADLLPASWIAWIQVLTGETFRTRVLFSIEGSGTYVFSRLNRLTIVLLFAVIPALLSDSLSRERRDATLGLLFLTPLNAGEVVLSKVFAHGLRGFMLWLAALPVLPLPLLLGGVDARECFLAASFQLAVVFLGLGSGILASSLCQRSGNALGLALAMNALAVLTLMNAHYTSFSQLLRSSSALRVPGSQARFALPPSAQDLPVPTIRSFFAVQNLLSFQSGIADDFPYQAWLYSVSSVSGVSTSWQVLWRDFQPAVHRRWFLRVLGMVAGCAVWTLICIGIAARRVTSIVRPAPVGKWMSRLNRGAATDLLPDLSRRWSQWLRSRNPFGWLGRQSWQNRMVAWFWLGATMTVSSALLVETDFRSMAQLLPHLLGGLAVLTMLFVSTMSFQRERDLGVLELLLSSPASARELARGRLTSIWIQALPATLFILWLIRFLSNPYTWNRSASAWLEYPTLLTFAAFTSVPIGLHQGLRCRHWFPAFFRAGLLGIVLPLTLVWVVGSWLSRGIETENTQPLPASLVVSGFGVLLALGWHHWSQLVIRLEQRRFPLS